MTSSKVVRDLLTRPLQRGDGHIAPFQCRIHVSTKSQPKVRPMPQVVGTSRPSLQCVHYRAASRLSDHDFGRQVQTDCAWPLTQIDRSVCQLRKWLPRVSEAFPDMNISHKCGLHGPRLRRIQTEREFFVDRPQAGPSPLQIPFEGHGEHGICSTFRAQPFQSWHRKREQHTGARGNCRPGIPIDRARFTQPPALADAIKHRHIQPPPSLVRRFCRERHPPERPAGGPRLGLRPRARSCPNRRPAHQAASAATPKASRPSLPQVPNGAVCASSAWVHQPDASFGELEDTLDNQQGVVDRPIVMKNGTTPCPRNPFSGLLSRLLGCLLSCRFCSHSISPCTAHSGQTNLAFCPPQLPPENAKPRKLPNLCISLGAAAAHMRRFIHINQALSGAPALKGGSDGNSGLLEHLPAEQRPSTLSGGPA